MEISNPHLRMIGVGGTGLESPAAVEIESGRTLSRPLLAFFCVLSEMVSRLASTQLLGVQIP